MINVTQPPQQQSGLARLVKLGALGTGIATGNPELIAMGLAYGTNSPLMDLVSLGKRIQQSYGDGSNAAMQSMQTGRIPSYMQQPYDAGVNYSMLAGLRR